MYSKFAQRCLSLLMALAMVLSLTPLQVLAAETDDSVPMEAEEVFTETSEATTGSAVTPEDVQARIDALLASFGITDVMTDDEIANAIIMADSDTMGRAMGEIEALNQMEGSLTIGQLQGLSVQTICRFLSIVYQLQTPVPLATSVDLLNSGLTISSSSKGTLAEKHNTSVTGSGTTVTITEYVSCVWYNALGATGTATVTIKNNLSNKAELSFSWSASNYSDISLGSAEGSKSYTLEGGASTTFTISVKAGAGSNKTATITLSNIKLEEMGASSTITVNHDSTLGSVTVDGSAAASGSQFTVETGNSLELAATANSGATFMGWVNEATNQILSSAATFTYTPAVNTTVKAVFRDNSSTTGWWMVNNAYLFDDLNAAAGMDGANSVVLLNNATLPAGDYSIPSGVTVLIPFDANATICREAPNTSDASSLTKPTPFRTLTLAEGASISVDGELSISGTQHSAMAVGTPFGPVGFIQMQSGSNITINNGGKLYAWGYITGTGTGSVTVKSGGTVYECFQVSDWRGSSATSSMSSNKEKIFPITQYYLQNVEVPMRLEAGASEYGFMSVNVTLVGIQTTLVPFIGPNAMFRINEGAIVKDYIESEDRLNIDLDNAKLSISPLTISIKASVIGTVTLNSANFVLPLASNMTLNINTGSKVELSQDIAFLPGTEVNIAEGAFCTVTGNSNIYVYDVEAWGDYCGAANKKLTTIAYAPGQQKVRTENDLVDAAIKVNGTVDATNGYLYTTSVPDENGNITGGANIYSEGTGKIIQRAGANKVTYQATYVKDGYTPHEIPIIPAKLKHEDGTYLDTSSATTATTYNHDHYTCLDHGDTTTDSMVAKCGTWYAGVHGLSEVETPPTCITEGYTTYTCTCGHSYTANKTDFADHTPAAAVQENVKKATCLEPGSYDSVIYCSVSNCGAELSRTTISVPAAGHTYVDGKCSVCGCVEVSFTIAHNLALKELVQIGYWVKAESTAEIKDVGVLIWKEADYFAEDKHDISSDTAVNPAMTSRQGFMMGYGEGIYAQYLDTKYYAVPYVVTSDGSYVYSGTPDVYAAPTYALQMGNQPEKVKTVVRDLLNYGTYAQLYFDSRPDGDIDTSTRINDVLEDAQKKLRYSDTMLVEEITADKTAENTNLSCTWRYSTAELLDAIQLNFFADQSSAFTNMLHWNETDYTAANTMKKDNATTVLNIIDKSIVEGDVTVCGSISGIYPKNLTKWHYACMYNSADNTYGPLRVDSVACYLSRMISNLSKYAGQESEYGYLLETCKAMLAYGDSAKTYAGS